ncbi:hypothetical protein COCNU_scaffold006752G000010 [Cocos nucifera]|nr:hypothetical protein [Cocos nucifera]
MSSASKASLIVAASMGAVEALKDQAGLCRWNYAIRSLNRQAKNSFGSLSQARRMSSSSSSSSSIEKRKGMEGTDEKAKRSEEALRKVMYLSCWGPN